MVSNTYKYKDRVKKPGFHDYNKNKYAMFWLLRFSIKISKCDIMMITMDTQISMVIG